MQYQPPFTITPKIINLISIISEQIGRLDGQGLEISPQLRKQNRIQTIHSTLAIEGNTLSIEQITAILDGKRVLGQPREIIEVQGAIRAYETLPSRNPASLKDFLQAHHDLMSEILAKRVPELMGDLLDWVKTTETHALIKSCVFHYELEFIHPFMDGNGRMGRLWQTLILGQWNDRFYLLPIDSLIKDQQERYYQVLEAADKAASSTVFIEFMLEIINTVLDTTINE